jgi:mRNA turnover protein 4
MPKSKRSKVIPLTKTDKKGKAIKENLTEKIRENLDKYSYVWIFSVDNMRNTYLKEVREDWKDRGRFFLGRTKIMAKVLGTNQEEEYFSGLSRLSELLKGNVGLFLTNEDPEQVKEYFSQMTRDDYARGGNIATETVILPEGPLYRGVESFPNSMEPMIRALGVPSLLKNGIVTLQGEFTICTEGQVLSHDQAKLLKVFFKQMATFHVNLLGYWHNDEVILI